MQGMADAYPINLVDILIVNEREAADLLRQCGGSPNAKADAVETTRSLLDLFPDMRLVVCTFGSNGSVFVCTPLIDRC